MTVSTLPLRPRPRLVDVAAAKPEFTILGQEVREAAGNIKALSERINRGLSGPYSTVASRDAAEWHAAELATAAKALVIAIRKERL